LIDSLIGKTYTVEGIIDDFKSSESGLIPRTVNMIFQQLEAQQLEYSVKISCLELYNEDLSDLLGDQNNPQELKLFEDTTG